MNRSYWLLPMILLGQAACGDLLTESPRGVLTTDNFYQTAADARSAVVAVYRPWTDGDLFNTSLQWALNASSDYARVGPEEENPNIVNLTRLGWNQTNPYTSNPWNGFYTVITRANIVLEKVPNTAMDETEKGYIIGEAHFLRALAYFYLARLYGEVPLVRNEEEQLSNPGRSPVDEVYQQVVDDATAAAAALPTNWPSSERGRATSGAAHALLGDYSLWRQDWAQAAEHAKQIIDSGEYALTPDYLDAFLPGSQMGTEEVFGIQSSSATGAPTVETAVWYYPRIMGPGQTGGWATMVPLAWHLDSYAEGDYRREVSYFTEGRLIDGSVVTFSPHVFKYRPTTRPGPQDANWPVYRYADVLLMYAEARNEMGEVGDALQYVNQIRARARNGAGGENRAAPADLPAMSQAELRDAIFEERRFELAFEGKRWLDLVRRGQAAWEAAFANDETATEVAPHKMLWPVPQSQIDLNPALTQNPGY